MHSLDDQTDPTQVLESDRPDVSHHRCWLDRVVENRVGRGEAADDVVQEVALAVAKATSWPADESEQRAWLCTIAIRQCALALRNNQRYRDRVEAASQNGVPKAQAQHEPTQDPIYWLLHSESKELIREAIGKLEADARDLLIAKYLHGRTYRELGNAHNQPPHAVEYRVAVARRQLRGLLRDLGVSTEDLP